MYFSLNKNKCLFVKMSWIDFDNVPGVVHKSAARLLSSQGCSQTEHQKITCICSLQLLIFHCIHDLNG